MTTLTEQIDQVVATYPFGRASAAKRGRRQDKWPYVPVIDHGAQSIGVNRTWTEQIRGKAFDSRDHAVAYASAVIEARRKAMREKLLDPRFRAFREQCGLPMEIQRENTL